MSIESFLRHFSEVSICHNVSTSMFNARKSWHETELEGCWTLGAMGNPKARTGDGNDILLANPQVCASILHRFGDLSPIGRMCLCGGDPFLTLGLDPVGWPEIDRHASTKEILLLPSSYSSYH